MVSKADCAARSGCRDSATRRCRRSHAPKASSSRAFTHGHRIRSAVSAAAKSSSVCSFSAGTARAYGELVRLAPPVQFSETKGYWEDPVLTVRGASKPQWRNG
jgi:hypothetical protein